MNAVNAAISAGDSKRCNSDEGRGVLEEISFDVARALALAEWRARSRVRHALALGRAG